jgi:hypothetical protein
MSHDHFDFLWTNIRFSYQPDVCPEGSLSEKHHWMLVDDFVTAFNEHCAAYALVSDRICVDESFSRWYGQGGSHINHGLPCYMSFDRKPEDGCEIQTSCNGRSGMML